MRQRPIIVSNWPRGPWGASFATANANKAHWERAWPPKLQTICRPSSLFDISTIRTRLWPSGRLFKDECTSPTPTAPAGRDALLAGLVSGHQHRAARPLIPAPLNISGRALTCVGPPTRLLPESPEFAEPSGRTPMRRSAFRRRAHSGPGQRGSARS
jgi:hypothetical protein